MDLGARAAAACAEYDHWASEIVRLTAEIGTCDCPPGAAWSDEGPGTGEDSCFRKASLEEFPGELPDEGARRRDLAAIARAVADCATCSRLCLLIAARKHARQRFGVAKRKVRQIGRLATPPSGLVTSESPGGQ